LLETAQFPAELVQLLMLGGRRAIGPHAVFDVGFFYSRANRLIGGFELFGQFAH
jgi:hypothetical protein